MKPASYACPLTTSDIKRIDARTAGEASEAFPTLSASEARIALFKSEAVEKVFAEFNDEMVLACRHLHAGRLVIYEAELAIPSGTYPQRLHISCLIDWQYSRFKAAGAEEEFKWVMSIENETNSVRCEPWWWFQVYGGFDFNALVPVHSLPSAGDEMRTNEELDDEFLRGERHLWEAELTAFEAERSLPYLQPGPYCLEARVARRKVILKTWMNTPKLYGLSDALGVLRYCRFIREQGGLRR